MQLTQNLPHVPVSARRLSFENARLEAELGERFRELRASRARVVSAADAERRRIERDLHDGAQQRLLSLRVKLGLIEDQLDGASATVRELVHELALDAESALDELHALVRGIYPPVLVDRGLAAALHSLAADAPLSATLELSAFPRYPAGIEAAVYFCCAEAVQNAAKHAGRGASIAISVGIEGEGLAFEARDDGGGIDPVRPHGTGLANMRDRVGAVGGELEIVSGPGRGTTVRGVVPLGMDVP